MECKLGAPRQDAVRTRFHYLKLHIDNSVCRPLIHCHLSLHLMPTRLTIHPILHPTFYLPLFLPASLASGVPIVLVPYAVPAYFLTNYTGPTSALTAQFEASL